MTPADSAAKRLEAWESDLRRLTRFYDGDLSVPKARQLADDLALILSERRKPDPLGEGKHEPGCPLADVPLQFASCTCGLVGAEPSLVSPPPPLPPQLLALSKAATPGKWHRLAEHIQAEDSAGFILVNVTRGGLTFEDAALIVAAVNYIRSCESAGAEST